MELSDKAQTTAGAAAGSPDRRSGGRDRRIGDLSDRRIEELLGRRPIDTGVSAVSGYLAGKRVLVTGAGGSIGSELCRHIHRAGPAELIMLDQDESALHGVQLSIFHDAMMDSPNLVLADIRDRKGMLALFAEHAPQVVLHAAALKHLPVLERYPLEAWRTNVLGTANVLEAACSVDVERFVGISTDKAANPSSILGYTKRVGELLVAGCNERSGGTFLSVRFGNVLGSRGSVLATFTGQIAAGKTLTITHPDVSRYFMTVQEAVQLVLQAGAIGRPHEVLVLDMGTPVRIADLARRLMQLADRTVDIVYTGLRAAEKIHEELFFEGEFDRRPFHPLISHADVPSLALERLPVITEISEVTRVLHSLTQSHVVPLAGSVTESQITVPQARRREHVLAGEGAA